ncbi:MAG: class B sortase [Oscillospiraceae bacterium]|nr:class B sortase [Oscillospiraceae bacterium]
MKKSRKSKSGGSKGVRVLLFFLCAVFAGVFVFSGYKLYTIMHGYHESEKTYSSLTDRYVAPIPSTTPYAAPVENAVPAPTPELSPIQVDFNELRGECRDIVGWLYSEGTKINYHIVQSMTDNPSTAEYYYLYRDIHGNYSGNGTPFLDVQCAGDFSDYNSIIYGHHMNDGSMFASLDNYRAADGAYAREHNVMYLNTPNGNYRVELFAGYLTDADSNTYTISFPDDSSFLLYCQEMKAKSDFASDVVIQPGDRIITLSTCSYEWHDARYVVQGRLVPLNAGSAATTTVSAVANG